MLVELHPVGVASTPLNATVLLPCDMPKDVPVIVTEVPTLAGDGEIPVIAGDTVKAAPLLGDTVHGNHDGAARGASRYGNLDTV